MNITHIYIYGYTIHGGYTDIRDNYITSFSWFYFVIMQYNYNYAMYTSSK